MPLDSWFDGFASIERFRRATLGRTVAVLPALDDEWRSVAPDFDGAAVLAGSGLPVHVVADGSHDRAPDPGALDRALLNGKTALLVQPHQYLPRLARLVVALRAAFTGPFREECSFLFLVNGTGRAGMGLHHDGNVDSFWLQLEGRRTVAIGPPVARGTPASLDEPSGRARRGFRTLRLEPGTLFHMPPRTPHRVVCYERSLAVSLTFRALDPMRALEALCSENRPSTIGGPATAGALRRALARIGRAAATAARDARTIGRLYAQGASDWNVVSGRWIPRPKPSPDRLWLLRPLVLEPARRVRAGVSAWTSDAAGEPLEVRLPAAARPLALRLASLASLTREDVRLLGEPLGELLERGIVGPMDLPLRIEPEDRDRLDGWSFA